MLHGVNISKLGTVSNKRWDFFAFFGIRTYQICQKICHTNRFNFSCLHPSLAGHDLLSRNKTGPTSFRNHSFQSTLKCDSEWIKRPQPRLMQLDCHKYRTTNTILTKYSGLVQLQIKSNIRRWFLQRFVLSASAQMQQNRLKSCLDRRFQRYRPQGDEVLLSKLENTLLMVKSFL